MVPRSGRRSRDSREKSHRRLSTPWPISARRQHRPSVSRLFSEIGKPKTGAALKQGKELMKRGSVDLSALDAKVEELCAKILLTFPDCTTKTVEELRKPKLEAWNRNKEDARAWLALNMVTEARAGFIAFNEGPKDRREVDFIKLRQKLAAGQPWVGTLHDEIQP